MKNKNCIVCGRDEKKNEVVGSITNYQLGYRKPSKKKKSEMHILVNETLSDRENNYLI